MVRANSIWSCLWYYLVFCLGNRIFIESRDIDGSYSEISGIINEAKKDVKIKINISMVTLY